MTEPRVPRAWRLWLPLTLLTALGGAVAWLNRSPWWGWALVAVVLVTLALTARWWRRGPGLLRAGAWLLAAAVVCATAVLAHPGPQVRMAGGSDPRPTEVVDTAEGPVRGVRTDDGSVEVFAGIPYAAPPVGDLRWRAPQPPAVREEILDADRFGPVPVQATTGFTTRALAQVVDVPLEDTFLNPYPVSEDSLSLNIWRTTRPEPTDPLPVLVYIPGGGFSTGSGALPLYDGAALAARGDLITVTVNYRLGVLGFLSHPDLAQESPDDASGNYGILDQIAALQWVQDNIAAFGGDPDRVTVAGESAGGDSVCILGATPLADGLVDGLIGASGACMTGAGDIEDGAGTDTRAAAEAAGERLTERLEVDTMEGLRALPADAVVAAAEADAAHWRPSIDGHVLDRAPWDIYAAGDQLDVPTLLGSNADEASLALASPPDVDLAGYRAQAEQTYGEDAARFLELYPARDDETALGAGLLAETDRVMTAAMYRWALLQESSGRADAYVYYFTRVPPEDGLEMFGAYHGAEVQYAYDNLGADSDARYTDVDRLLRDRMSGYWVNFVRTGDPNGDGLPHWPTLAEAPEQVMEFGDRTAMAPRPRPDAIDFWLEREGPLP